MSHLIPLTDDELLSSGDPEDFGVFYDRHVKALLGYFARRTFDPEEADAEMIRLLADDSARSVLSELPPEQRRIVAAHVIDERPCGELSGELHTSEAAVRQRV
jgi:hypothetical protein